MTSQLVTTPEHLEMIKPEPEIDALLAVSDFTKVPTEIPDPAAFITNLRAVLGQTPDPVPREGITQVQVTYQTHDGTTLRMWIYRPTSAKKAVPLLVFYHGGGMCIGSPEGSSVFCQDVALQQNVVVMAPSYRLAPEFPYPYGMEDCYDGLRHAHRIASSYNADPGLGLVVGGESAGAVISAIMALRAQDDGLNPPVTGSWLAAGSYIPPHAVPEEYRPHYLSRFDPTCLASLMLSEVQKKAIDACFNPDYSDPKYRASIWPTGLRGLGRTYLQACGADINRDDTYIYRDMLSKQDVETRFDVYPGTPHIFWFAFPQTRMGRKWKDDTMRGLAWLFEADHSGKTL